jgi:EAL domain-containing protein (putative c-di-GMP-specific phosphodiesterase class I)
MTFSLSSTDIVEKSTFRHKGRTFGSFSDFQLTSAFQPIYSLAHKRIVGYEALVRAEDRNRQPVSPARLFHQDEDLSRAVFLDRLCRHVHIDNFQSFGDEVNWLFLNVSPQTIIHGNEFGSFFRDLLEKFKFPPHRIVIEIVEHPISGEDSAKIVDSVKYYQELGCLTAIDDFGAGHSNFDRIWTLKPDLVKLDRSMLLKASDQEKIRQLLPGIVSLLHQAGALVIMEGIETEAQTLIAMESDIDMVQGYFFAKPQQDLALLSSEPPPFSKLFDAYKTAETIRGKKFQQTHERYRKRFLTSVALLQEGCALIDSSEPLFEDEGVIRCWLLNPNGEQVGSTITSRMYENRIDPRFRPLEDANSADWFRRHYLRRALLHQGQLQVTRPYLSITGAHMCSTLSLMFKVDDRDIILCCDLKV